MIQPTINQNTLSEQFLETDSIDLRASPSAFSLFDKYASVDTTNVMKKATMMIIGLTLFVAGYRHIQHHSQYVTAKAAPANPAPAYATAPATTVPDDIKHTVAFRLVKQS